MRDSKPGLTFFFRTLGGAYYRVGLTIEWGLLSKCYLLKSLFHKNLARKLRIIELLGEI